MKWRSFWELFGVSIHNNSRYSNIEKFVVLKSHLSGSAQKAIDGIPVSGDGYLAAIDILKRRFQRDDIERETLMKCLLDAPAVHNGNDLSAMRSLVDHLSAHTRALATLGVNPESSSIVLLPVMKEKLPESWRLEWARQEQPTYEHLLLFLEKELALREAKIDLLTVSTEMEEVQFGFHHFDGERRAPMKSRSAGLPDSADVQLRRPVVYLRKDDHRSQREAVRVMVILNLTSGGSQELVAELCRLGAAEPRCDLLAVGGANIIMVFPDAPSNVLRCAEQVDREGTVALQVDECGGLDRIESLQTYEDEPSSSSAGTSTTAARGTLGRRGHRRGRGRRPPVL
ncbi:Importin subunit alpha-1 [Amphibalanus amphitrite]|uniref:Importin subunit alpha-1 n=1 Tax=Amphibalanus amphitrite TaxID=1232801 RepID=A0A6A4WBI3_AMPAM|nr:Importin subunit alpha-1 [Amphibalanus amphitrite]